MGSVQILSQTMLDNSFELPIICANCNATCLQLCDQRVTLLG